MVLHEIIKSLLRVVPGVEFHGDRVLDATITKLAITNKNISATFLTILAHETINTSHFTCDALCPIADVP